MINVMITIDKVKSLRDLCREVFGECIRDEKGAESDCPFFGPRVRITYRTDGERELRSDRVWRPGSAGCYARRPKRRIDQFVYSGKVHGFQSGKGAEENPADIVPDGDDAAADGYVFEDGFLEEIYDLYRLFRYKNMGRNACADGED